MRQYQITQWCQRMMEDHIEKGDLCIDATAGNGNDTLFLCEMVGKSGKVLAFDIQEEALLTTEKKLKESNFSERVQLILDSHINMEKYTTPESANCIVFNFGYLPGGDHNLATKADTSITAIKKGLKLLKKGGMMSLCIYSGGDSGFEERDAILKELKELDSKQYLVIVSSYYNRPNNPPIPAMIVKL